MVIKHLAVTLLRVVLVALFGLLVLFQTMALPGQFAHMAREDPDMAYLRWPATAVTIFWVLCAQVVLIATWQLLAMVRTDRIFSEGAMVWVNAILAAIGAGWVVLVAVFLYVGFNASDPGLPLVLALMLAGVTVVGLVVVVLRALLRQATTLRTDMDAVI